MCFGNYIYELPHRQDGMVLQAGGYPPLTKSIKNVEKVGSEERIFCERGMIVHNRQTIGRDPRVYLIPAHIKGAAATIADLT